MVLERLSGRGKIVLCCSELIRNEVRRFFGYDAYVMWYPIDLSHFRPMDQEACRRQLGIEAGKPIGLFVGSIHPIKGFTTVEHLIHCSSHIQWILALRGEVPNKIRDIKGVNVFQNATYDLLPILYNAATFSLCPSIYDSFPYVVLEALSSGTPVIASPHGASFTFHSKTPLKPLLTNSANDIEGFKQAISIILSNPIEWRKIVYEHIHPLIEEFMAPENWWRRFCSVTDIKENA
jgi:UDP-glucose:(heptosyl)LPS alpha-1,3-glucosyltransferase